MNFLAVDTSSKHLTVLVQNNDTFITEHVANCQSQQSKLVMDAIESALTRADLTPNQCDFFAAAVGPGSFTGIRIGISVIKGFAYALQKPTLAVTSFDCLAYNGVGKLLCVIDANHNHFYAAGYNEDKSLFLSPCFIDLSTLQELSNEYPVYSFESLPVAHNLVDIGQGFALAIRHLAEKEAFSPSLDALYVRKSNAEENRK